MDVFFVISGFLITGIIVRQQRESGQVDLPRFYARRLRRIMPAAVLVTLITAAVGCIVWYWPRAAQNLLDAAASLLWVANWHFAATGTDYLAGSGTPPALQHMWSLSVEEQFYVVWPWVLMLATSTYLRRWKRERVLLILVAVVIAVSFAWSLIMTSAMPRLAYFDTIGRAWELAAGGLFAILVANGKMPRIPGAGFLGLGLIAGAAFVLDPSWDFPGPWAVVPVAGAVLIVAGRQDPVTSLVLDNPLMRWVGDRSYSLYLWHFPVVIFATALAGSLSLRHRFLLILLAVLLADLSFRFVEEATRHSGWLRSWERPSRGRVDVLTGAVISLCVLVLAAAQFNPSRFGVIQAETFPQHRKGASEAFETVSQARAAVAEGMSATSFAGAIPSPDDLGQEQLAATMNRERGCTFPLTPRPVQPCRFGEGTRKALLIGDSVAMTWQPAVSRALGPGTTLLVAGYASCAPWRVTHGASFADPTFPRRCDSTREALAQLVRQEKPDIIFVSSAAGAFPLVQGSDDDDRRRKWAHGVEKSLSEWKRTATRVVIIGNPPIGADPRECMTRLSEAGRCTKDRERFDIVKQSAEQEAARLVGATYVDVAPWFCAQDRCPILIGPYLSRTDNTHIVSALASAFGPLLKRESGL